MSADASTPPTPALVPGASCSTTCGPRTANSPSPITSTTTPSSSAATPTSLIRAISRTPPALTAVVKTSSSVPSSTALAAPDGDVTDGSPPTSWKPSHTDGSTICSAIAAAARATTQPRSIIQPASQPRNPFDSCFAHWYTDPASG